MKKSFILILAVAILSVFLFICCKGNKAVFNFEIIHLTSGLKADDKDTTRLLKSRTDLDDYAGLLDEYEFWVSPLFYEKYNASYFRYNYLVLRIMSESSSCVYEASSLKTEEGCIVIEIKDKTPSRVSCDIVGRLFVCEIPKDSIACDVTGAKYVILH